MHKFLAAAALAVATAAQPAEAGIRWNGPVLQGIRLNGISLQGPLLQGPILQGTAQAGTRANDWSAIELERVSVRLPKSAATR
jgi:hypothetical protein